MPDVDERLARVEQGLDSLGEHIDERFAQVDQRFDSLDTDVRGLRVLEEQNATAIKRIAQVHAHQGEVLAQHSEALTRIEKALEPLTVLPAAIQNVLPNHERRITALEHARPPGTP